MLLGRGNVVLLRRVVAVLQDDLYDLHAVILHFLNLMPRVICGLFSALFSLPRECIAVLQPIFFDIVVQIFQQLLTTGNQLLKGLRLFQSHQFILKVVCCCLASSILMDERLGAVDKSKGFFLDLPLEHFYLSAKLFDEFKFLHQVHRLPHVAAHLHEGRLQQSVGEEGEVFDVEHFDGVVAVVGLAGEAEDCKGLRTEAVHADEAVGGHLRPRLLHFIMLFANNKRHRQPLFYNQMPLAHPLFPLSPLYNHNYYHCQQTSHEIGRQFNSLTSLSMNQNY